MAGSVSRHKKRGEIIENIVFQYEQQNDGVSNAATARELNCVANITWTHAHQQKKKKKKKSYLQESFSTVPEKQ
jgi:spore germination cell wall hydrolase CwlJ-like protein